MRVLFLSQIVPYPPHGGVLQRGYNLVREIGRRNELHLLAFVHPDVMGADRLVDESRGELGRWCRSIRYFDLWPKKSGFHRLAGFVWGGVSSLPFSVLAHRSARFSEAMEAVMRGAAIDVVHYDTLALAQFGTPGTGARSALTHHNIESQLMERRAAQEPNALARRYILAQARKLRDYERAACGRFDVNIFVSEADAALMSGRLPGIRSAIVPNGVDVDYFRRDPGADRGEPSLIYTGGMNMFANRDAVLHFVRTTFPLIRKQVPEAVFHAVGQDPPEELRRMADADRGIVVTGFVKDIRPLVSRSAVYVVPLRVGGGTRLKILDAMAMERPIVATSIGAEGIDVADGVNIRLADDPETFAARTVELLRDPGMRRRMGAEARKLVETHYSWEIIGETLQAAYEATVRDAPGERATA